MTRDQFVESIRDHFQRAHDKAEQEGRGRVSFSAIVCMRVLRECYPGCTDLEIINDFSDRTGTFYDLNQIANSLDELELHKNVGNHEFRY